MMTYEQRKADAEAAYNAPLKTSTSLPGQKFSIGDKVNIVNTQTWFSKNISVDTVFTVDYCYGQKYGGNDINSYSLTNTETGSSSSWYYESELKKLEHALMACPNVKCG